MRRITWNVEDPPQCGYSIQVWDQKLILRKKTYILKFTWWKIRKIKTYDGVLSLMTKSTEETFKPKRN